MDEATLRAEIVSQHAVVVEHLSHGQRGSLDHKDAVASFDMLAATMESRFGVSVMMVVDSGGNEKLSWQRARGEYPFKWSDGHTSLTVLFNADPDCEHEEKRGVWSGIQCAKCPGWFCH